MIEKNNWRLTNQETHLMGITLWKKRYARYSETWDHDHCAFCWDKFSECAGDLHEGYCTEGEGQWICPACFEDFKEMFRWEVVDETANESGQAN